MYDLFSGGKFYWSVILSVFSGALAGTFLYHIIIYIFTSLMSK